MHCQFVLSGCERYFLPDQHDRERVKQMFARCMLGSVRPCTYSVVIIHLLGTCLRCIGHLCRLKCWPPVFVFERFEVVNTVRVKAVPAGSTRQMFRAVNKVHPPWCLLIVAAVGDRQLPHHYSKFFILYSSHGNVLRHDVDYLTIPAMLLVCLRVTKIRSPVVSGSIPR